MFCNASFWLIAVCVNRLLQGAIVEKEVKSNVTGVYSDGLDSESSRSRSGDLANRG